MKLDHDFLERMQEATRLLQTDGPAAATAAIQRALHGNTAPGAPASPMASSRMPAHAGMKDLNPPPAAGPRAATARTGDADVVLADEIAPPRESGKSADSSGHANTAGTRAAGRFLHGTCTSAAGTRDYKLFVPGGYVGEPLPLVVMLHGCTQDADDFAAGTGMNALAQERHCFVLYPIQPKRANGAGCWNWFDTGHQQRGAGEPAIIAEITRMVMREYKIDARRVYAAGLSAGGAMAAVLGATHPDLYAAIGIHSGLPYRAAHDVQSAFAAMKRRKGKAAASPRAPATAAPLEHAVPVIVFHGDRDTTVHPANGDLALAQFATPRGAGDRREARVEEGKAGAPGGRRYTRTTMEGTDGKTIAEKWIVHGAGHAWSGGSSSGSYTDPQGPDASAEMLRFFLDRENPAA